ncbi:MAG: hypothetical protein IJF17_05800 [Thermoguttaceae bacterium]|nr:hypothetical protein [Thermoguttaceae bacterium]
MYLVYDVRGIQKYIFAVPKLKGIIGGSLIVEEFDHQEAPQAAKKYGWECIFTGGGRGLFSKNDGGNIADLRKELTETAHSHGLDIRFGECEEMNSIPEAVDLYPFVPPMEPGKIYPCALSGLWPVREKGAVHELIKERMEKARRQDLNQKSATPIKKVLEELNEEFEELLKETCGSNMKMDFFRNVSPEEEQDQQEREEAIAAARALGNRNRWAVVCMDGNDMGRQIAHMVKEFAGEGEELQESREKWFKAFSSSLAECTNGAFTAALKETVRLWMEENREELESSYAANGCLILPFRPLILGGDDVTLLCHSGWAMEFVKQMSTAFTQYSEKLANEKKSVLGDYELWPATGNRLTISAGVLFCKTTYPLASAIEYTESLLASAKSGFRADPSRKKPSQPGVDWETVTETLVDSPAERRQREMWFRDGELGNQEIRLTDKPYSLEELVELDGMMKALEALPGTIRAGLLPGLRQPWSLRTAFLASLGKRHPELWRNLGKEGGRWWLRDEENEAVLKTRVIDAVTLLEEARRMEQETVR